MISRVLFALDRAYQRQAALKQVMRQSEFKLPAIVHLSAVWLKEQGIEYLLLDFDGVLAAHGASEPDPAVLNWLKELLKSFPAERLWIFSNCPTKERQVFFALHFPGVRWLLPVPKKPYPQALAKWLQSQGLLSSKVLLVDDRLLTGILCALLVGVKPLLIEKPLVNFKSRPFSEGYIRILRWVERRLFNSY